MTGTIRRTSQRERLPSRSDLRALAGLLGLLMGCDAQFTDLRPVSSGLEPSADAGFFDIGPAPMADRAVLEGVFEGRGRYTGRGAVSLTQRADSSLELSFGETFSVSSVPGPIVVLTTRSAIGAQLRPSDGDLDIGALISNSGRQSYPVPNAAVGAKYAWVFCRPFGVEIARASLSEASR